MSTRELKNRVYSLIESADRDFLEKILALSETNNDEIPEEDKNLVRERISKYGKDFSNHTKLEDLKKKMKFG